MCFCQYHKEAIWRQNQLEEVQKKGLALLRDWGKEQIMERSFSMWQAKGRR